MAKDKAVSEIARKLGRLGGKKRAKTMTPEQRSEIARKGAAAYWAKFPERRKKTESRVARSRKATKE